MLVIISVIIMSGGSTGFNVMTTMVETVIERHNLIKQLIFIGYLFIMER